MTRQPTTPVTDDANATVAELLARAAQDLDHAVTARLERETQGAGGQWQGIFPGGGVH